MKVAEIMETDVETVTPDTPVSEALVTLADARVSGLPVVDNSKRVIGVVSSTDLIGAQAETQAAGERRDSSGNSRPRSHDPEATLDRVDC
jgi:CBS domain-containing protein